MKRIGRQGSRSISEVLRQMEEKYHLSSPLTEAALKERWPAIMGTLIANHTKNIRFKEGTLTLTIDNAPLKAELMMRKDEIMQRINTDLGTETIREVHIR